MNPRQVLESAIKLQLAKGADYQSNKSKVKQADYYLRGVDTIYDTMWGKLLRIRSVLDSIKNGNGQNFESVQDSCIDLINYAAFMSAYIDHDIEGQDQYKNIFNDYEIKPVLPEPPFATKFEVHP
jgi:hypothetical protein